ncbi:MAG: 4-alpha-glucanotransferase [Candidatus Dormibacteria bacterium]
MPPVRRRPQPERWGVQTEYVDATGARRRVPPEAVQRALASMRASAPAPADDGPVFARHGERLPAAAVGVVTEQGDELDVRGAVPPGLPAGYHRLRMRRGDERELIVAPARCHLSDNLRAWGWAAQLYAVRSARSWGMGDLGDLAALGRWSRSAGAGVLQLNPLHAAAPGEPQEASPYFPSSRLFRNPLYLAIEQVPGAAGDREIAAIAETARTLNRRDVIERDRVNALKMQALARLYQRFNGSTQFAEFCERAGDTLRRYACFCVLAERHGGAWRTWPEQFRRPDSPALTRLEELERRRVNFHRWLQWQLELQLSRAEREIMIMHDVAVGFSPDGADAWLWQDLLTPDMRIGAPPDEYNIAGQDWGLPPFDPHRLRAAGFSAFRDTLRAVMRPDSAVRIDHVMGLFRLWWVPRDSGPAGGVYVRYPSRELMDIVALESARARCVVVGEDLGTVEPGVRTEMRRRAMLSYRVAWFEDRPPSRYPRHALAAVTTHDLPTIAGVWTGADIDEMRRCGVAVNDAAEARVRRRLDRLVGAPSRLRMGDVIERTHRSLAEAPSMLLLATLDDAAGSSRRPNIPNARGRANWSLPLPRTLEQLRRNALPQRIARAFT